MPPKIVTRHSGEASGSDGLGRRDSGGRARNDRAMLQHEERLDAPGTPGGSSLQEGRVTRSRHLTRRLSLESTFNQRDENELSGLLQRMDNMLRARQGLQAGNDRLEGVFALAVEINSLRLQQGDHMDRLTHFFRKWMVPVDAVADEEGADEASGRLTKSQLLRAAADTWKARVGARPRYMWLSLKGHSISIDRLCEACSRYRGPLLNLMDVRTCPPQLLPLSQYLALLGSTTGSIHAQLRERKAPEEVAALQEKLATLQTEFSSLACLIYACNARFHGVREAWQAPTHLEGFVQQSMAGLGLRAEQMHKLRVARREMREQLSASTIGANCSSDMLEDALCMPMPPDKHTILQLVEAIESCRLDSAALYVQCATTMLVDVLDSLQAALLIKACIAIFASMPPPPPELEVATRKRLICSFLLDDRLSSWLDKM